MMMIDVQQRYDLWITKTVNNLDLNMELIKIKGNSSNIADCFYRDLEFGTGGLRGIIGAGTNRMNIYTVSKATQGLANYLYSIISSPSVCIAYDTRNMSKEFADAAAEVLCANGVKTYLFDEVTPTPMLSFAVRNQKADAGIVITASHNPKEYNGYKVYGSDGGQITDRMASDILARINDIDIFNDVKCVSLKDTTLLSMIGEAVNSSYYKQVKSLSCRPELLSEKADKLSILYSALHGSGNIPVRHMLDKLGFTSVDIVPEQEKPDGNFPTCPYPNPEEPAVYTLAITRAKTTNPDLIFATDPDCDRIGVLVKGKDGEYSVLSGNQVGALLCDYILSAKKEAGTLSLNAAVIKTIVTTEMATPICKYYGATLVDTLTGFKYIGEKIGEWEQTGEYTFQFGFEESYGYLSGDFVRDKDAVIAAALIAEMALWYKTEKNMSLYDALQNLFERFGYYSETLLSITMPGAEGQQGIASIIADLRENIAPIEAVGTLAAVEDYKLSTCRNVKSGIETSIQLPKSNVLKFVFDDNTWIVLRPSGTEPKIKAYIGVSRTNEQTVKSRLESVEKIVKDILC